ncbi:HAD-IA family hydrolase [Maribacter sp. HTCC2170]|uniref:HAD-IA family hydrolase n=1 Tax=Maribacter sp. (strain HTCC2170 / KCCM 42371) TaxID=313603 RepID=UPI00006B4896|nr:HAD-IA family hydrolase [Maribacter sp. HTCC2170]EAR01538.1 putative haloacid dehalogenase-like hydrolase [Maribacter sp. HTCC2170]
MIENIIFDFGDIFINLDKEIVFREMQNQGVPTLNPEILSLSLAFEVGEISPQTFVGGLKSSFPKATSEQIITIWNGMLLDFPDYRLDFLEKLAKENKYRLFLLSNTNALHIPEVVNIMGDSNYNRFKNSFEQFYLSHEIHLRKPNADIFEFVLSENNLNASETLFIDDTLENTEAADKLGINTWNLIVGKEDIIDLKTKL